MPAFLLFVFVCLAGSPAWAQAQRPEVNAVRLSESDSIVLDGSPDEAVWKTVVPATNFRQRDPDNGQPASERTEVRVLFDKDRLILGVTCFDSEPDRLLGNQMQRDQPFSADDRFMWSIDPFLDGRSGYFFEINPSGAMGDGLITGPAGGGGGFGGQMNKSWDGIWIARVRRSGIGWTAEIEIPFKTLNFDPNSVAWGANFQRTVRRKNEESLWTGFLRNEGLTRMSNAGRVNGIRDISQGIGLDLKPYGLGAAGNAPGRGTPGTSSDFDFGLDAFYNVTPALKANFTVNTDFAETEVDQRRTNLTRFPLFFPEKREFFLDGSNFFAFPTGGQSPFFSRRIGLNAGQPQPILYGAKLTGQVGRQDIGFLHVSTSEEESRQAGGSPIKGEDFTVARVRRRVGSQSSAGVLYTRRAPRDSLVDPRHTLAADVIVATPNFVGGSVLDSNLWYIHTTKPDRLTEDGVLPPPGGSDAYGWNLSVDKDPWDASVGFQEYQAAYDAAVGFTPRRNYRAWDPRVGWYPRLNQHPWIRGFRFNANMELNLSLDNELVDRNIYLTPLDIEFHSGDGIEFAVFRQTEQLDEDFEISDGVVLPMGPRYAWTRYQVELQSAQRRKVAANAEVSVGDFWNGSRREVNFGLSLRPRPGLLFQLASEYNDVDLPQGSFTTRLYRFDARTQFGPWVSLTNNVQYDSESSEVGWQLRFRWIQKPGNDLFFIWTQNWLDDTARGLQALDRRGAAKIVRTFRF